MMPLTPLEEMTCFILELILLPIARRILFHLGNLVSDDTWDLAWPWLCNRAVKAYIRSFVEWSPFIAIQLYLVHTLLLRRGIDLPGRLATYRRQLTNIIRTRWAQPLTNIIRTRWVQPLTNIIFNFGNAPQDPHTVQEYLDVYPGEWWLNVRATPMQRG